MKKIYTSEDRFLVQRVKDALDEKGYECHLRNQYAAGGAGDLSPLDCWPEVWLVNDEDYAEAIGLVQELFESTRQGKPWQCRHCGEQNEPSFELCWRCGADQNE